MCTYGLLKRDISFIENELRKKKKKNKTWQEAKWKIGGGLETPRKIVEKKMHKTGPNSSLIRLLQGCLRYNKSAKKGHHSP